MEEKMLAELNHGESTSYLLVNMYKFEMSVILRLAFARYLKRTPTNIARLISVNHAYIIPGSFRINYFIPRTVDIPLDRAPSDKRLFNIPKDYKVIYEIPKAMDTLIHLIPYIATGMFAIIILSVIYHNDRRPVEDLIAEKNNPVSEEEELSASVDCFPRESVKKNFKHEILKLNEKVRNSASFMSRSTVALILLAFILYLRSVVVLTIYRKNNNFVTVFYKLFSSDKKVVEHSYKECYYNPHLMMFQHKLCGKNILIFPELFKSTNDEYDYVEYVKKK